MSRLFGNFEDVFGLRIPKKQGRMQQRLERNMRLVGKVNVPEAGGDVPFAL